MKKTFYILFLLTGLFTACSSDDSNNNLPTDDTTIAKDYTNLAYGNDPEQIMDVYLPAGRTENTKVIMLIHGGAWTAGSKEDYAEFVPFIKTNFPDCAIVNINYRLATETSPAFPKQTDDIQKVFDYLENRSGYIIDDEYAIIGASAGAHLAMLHGYKYDTQHKVKAICDIVGPADFTDPMYTSHPIYGFAAYYLLGTYTPIPSTIAEVNPVSHITAQSPPTISFYGGMDELVPATQGPILHEALNAAGVVNEFNFYPNGGHADWDDATFNEVYTKMIAFLNTHLQ